MNTVPNGRLSEEGLFRKRRLLLDRWTRRRYVEGKAGVARGRPDGAGSPRPESSLPFSTWRGNRSISPARCSDLSLECGSSALAFPEAGLATGLATGLAPSDWDDSWAISALLRDGVAAAALLSGLVAFACIHRSG